MFALTLKLRFADNENYCVMQFVVKLDVHVMIFFLDFVSAIAATVFSIHCQQ